MDIATLGLFVAGALTLIALPGPDFLYVATRGLAQGRRAGVLSAGGISLGLLVHTALASGGLTVLLSASPTAFAGVKLAGAAYLLWLGVKMLRGGDETVFGNDVPPLDSRAIVRQAMLTNVFNPKVALTFGAFLPQFVRADSDTATLQIAFLGGMMALMAGAWFSVVGYLSGGAGAKLLRGPRFARAMRYVGAGVFLLLGVRLAFAEI